MLENISTVNQIIIFTIIGFIAQMIDGALGMAYGVSATSLLLSFGVPPALSSAGVHAAECVTTLISGLSHWKFGNVDKRLFFKLVIPGMIGAVIGAYILSNMDTKILKPLISVYLLLMGILILWKAFKQIAPKIVTSWLVPLGLAGGFLDAIGGGGWGPVVTSTLVARGNNPRLTIGSTNAAEFFIALSSSIVFFLELKLGVLWVPVAGLALGGAIAAPLAALITRRVSTHKLMILVGLLICILSIRTLLKSLGYWPWF
jgi:uncharacterized membrane protein YfcA